MKKILFLFISLLLFPVVAHGSNDECAIPMKRIITDMRGHKVEIPYIIGAYVESWSAHITIDIMLDHAEKMVGLSVPIKKGNFADVVTPRRISKVEAVPEMVNYFQVCREKLVPSLGHQARSLE